MTKQSLRSCRLVLAVSMTVTVVANSLCCVARADDLNAGKSIRIPAAAFVPIGSVYSLAELSINGHAAGGEQLLWNGDLLEVSDEASVLLDSIGKLRLMRGTVVRLATGLTARSNDNQRSVLIATLIVGEMMVSLQQESFAHIETRESVIAASDGANFRLTIGHGQAVIDRVSGIVRAEPQSGVQSKYIQFTTKQGRSLGPDPKKEVKRDTPEELYVLLQRPKASAPRRILFTPSVRPISLQTTQEFLPVPSGKVVAFRLDPSTNGTFDPPNATATTNSSGIASVTFTGKVPGPAQVIAIDLENGETATIAITVVKGPGIFRKRNILIGAAAVGVVICVFACSPRKGPLRQVSPPIIQ